MSEIKPPMIFARDYIHMLRDKGFDISEHDRVKLEKYLKQYTEPIEDDMITRVVNVSLSVLENKGFTLDERIEFSEEVITRLKKL